MPLAAPSALRGEAAQNPSAKVAHCLERLQTSPKGKHRKNTKHIPHIPTVLDFFHVFFQGPTAPMAEGICWDPSGLNILETYWIIVTIKDHNFGPFQLVLLP